MLNVKTPEEVNALMSRFAELRAEERIRFTDALGRVLAQDILAEEYVPDFTRSSVDGFAVRAEDTFGCSDSIPAILEKNGQVLMGEHAQCRVMSGTCAAVPTGGEIPDGADSMVMVEYTEDYGDGTIGITKPAAPGMNMVYRGDDVKPGKKVLEKGKLLDARDIGTLAAMGITTIPVKRKVRVAIISTGDELVDPEEKPKAGQVRNVNSYLLTACVAEAGGEPVNFGTVKDEWDLLDAAVERARADCDMILISGGTSVGVKNATSRMIESKGSLLFHGIAMKPGKPTILGEIDGKPVWGLPGHPAAAAFVMRLFVLPLMDRLAGCARVRYPVTAILEESVGANHGRAQYTGAVLREKEGRWYATPIRSKSGLITALSRSDGFFCIDRDCEGLAAGTEVQVYSFQSK